MPHSRYDDSDVEQIYAILSSIIRQARLLGRIFIVMGDWNATIGRNLSSIGSEYIGKHGLGLRNPRGDLFASWAIAEKMDVANTQFEKTYDKKWTHRGPYGQRQLDYACIDFHARRFLKDAEASDEIGLGMDHRSVKIEFEMPRGGRRRKHFAEHRKGTGWRPRDESAYKEELHIS